MRKHFLPLAAYALVCLFPATASATANFVYHEQTANFVAAPTCPLRRDGYVLRSLRREP